MPGWIGVVVVLWLLLAGAAAAAPGSRAAPSAPMRNAPGALALTANASAFDTGGSWNCGQGQEIVDLFGQGAGGTSPYSYRWDFGDGSASSAAQNPVHTYHNVLKFTANLTVTDATNTTVRAVASGSWGIPLDCAGSRTTDWGGLLVYSGLVAAVAVGAVLFVRYRPDRPRPPL
ncbi:MAG: PKD domain-containing protein [Thermoplasmata archaeon]|nr:PKD domain-containing protein [Thermoplasmata archaeon]MCI4353787.1 PKD domain-containing protein [Thermoplasmata archaeon]